MFIVVFLFPYVVSSQANSSFNKVWLEHNVTSGGDKGMIVHADFTVSGMKGKQIEVISFFYDESKNKHFGSTRGFKATDNHICVSETAEPGYINSHYSDFKLFIPYSAMNFKTGEHKYYCSVLIRDVSNNYRVLGKESQYLSFMGTGDDRGVEKALNNGNKGVAKTVRYYGDSGIMFVGASNSLINVSGYVDVYYDSDGKACAYRVNEGTLRTLEEINKNNYKTNDNEAECKVGINEEEQYVNMVYESSYMGIRHIIINSYTRTTEQKNGNRTIGNPMIIGGSPGVISGSSSNSSVYTRCSVCGGSGICRSCNGRGGEWRDTGYYTGSDVRSWIECPSCRGNTRCYMCHGSGRY